MADDIHDAFIRYHYSLRHKLDSAKYYLESIERYIEIQKTEEDEPVDIVYRVNFYFDGFTHAIGSALDIFARELLTYFGHPLPTRVYFQTAIDQLTVSHPGNPIIPTISFPRWRQEFGEYRNTATHECVVGQNFTGTVNVIGGVTYRELIFPLPDDPRAHHGAKTYNRNPDIVEYCRKTFKRTLLLLNPAYREIREQGEASGGFPI